MPTKRKHKYFENTKKYVTPQFPSKMEKYQILEMQPRPKKYILFYSFKKKI
jgi:hypothetical protein